MISFRAWIAQCCTVLVLLLVALVLPTVAKVMQAAVTPLIGVLILLVGLRLFLPHRH